MSSMKCFYIFNSLNFLYLMKNIFLESTIAGFEQHENGKK